MELGLKNLLVITGPSNSGKDTLKEQLRQLAQHTDMLPHVNVLTMHTTRPARAGEQCGKEYYFDTMEQYHQADLLTHAMYRVTNGDDWYYWVEKEDLKEDPQTINILFIGIQELYELKKKVSSGEIKVNLWLAYLHTDEEERLVRAINRSERETKGIKEVIRRAYADLSDYGDEVLKKVGITKDQQIESNTDALVNLLTMIYNIRMEISGNYLDNMREMGK